MRFLLCLTGVPQQCGRGSDYVTLFFYRTFYPCERWGKRWGKRFIHVKDEVNVPCEFYVVSHHHCCQFLYSVEHMSVYTRRSYHLSRVQVQYTSISKSQVLFLSVSWLFIEVCDTLVDSTRFIEVFQLNSSHSSKSFCLK